MSKNNLDRARKLKRDDFYTQYETVAAEVPYYTKHFKDKIVLCNCNDGPESSFTRYFLDHFKELGLKRLVTTSYENALRGPKEAIKYEYTGPGEPRRTRLTSGDYRAPECLELLDEADIVVTNPPFSKFRDFLDVLIEHEKSFLILGNLNTLIATKKSFIYFMEGLWQLGVSIHSGGIVFDKPSEYSMGEYKGSTRELSNIRWVTNINHGFIPEKISLKEIYTPEKFPAYDDVPIINVDRTRDIPKNYDGLMGVPITFIDKYNPEQFELIGVLAKWSNSKWGYGKPIINGIEKYKRLVIKKRSK